MSEDEREFDPAELAEEASSIALSSKWSNEGIESFFEMCLKENLYTPLTLPSGLKILATRPPVADEWSTFGFLPEAQVKESDYNLAAQTGNVNNLPVEEKQRAMREPERLMEAATLAVHVLEWTFLRPRIRVEASGEGEIEPSRISPEDGRYVLDWVKNGCCGVPIVIAD